MINKCIPKYLQICGTRSFILNTTSSLLCRPFKQEKKIILVLNNFLLHSLGWHHKEIQDIFFLEFMFSGVIVFIFILFSNSCQCWVECSMPQNPTHSKNICVSKVCPTLAQVSDCQHNTTVRGTARGEMVSL